MPLKDENCSILASAAASDRLAGKRLVARSAHASADISANVRLGQDASEQVMRAGEWNARD